MFELQAAGKGIGFRTEIGGVLPEVVKADEKRLRQILINVAGNAVKFTASGQVVFRASHARETARFEIEDSGPGMGPDELARVFEPFVRGSAAGRAAAGGTGLGLTIAKMLTDLMGGEMTVASTPGVGTCFTIRLFLPELRESVVGRVMPKGARTGYSGARRRILAVDNEEVDRELIASLLQPLGFEVMQAASGEECLALLRAGAAPDAIFMDLAMAGIDGWETIRRLRAEGLSTAPVAVVSANAFDKGLDNDAGIASADFIVKPVRVGELLDWLGERLALTWLTVPTEAASGATAAVEPSAAVPPAEQLRALAEAVQLGYYRGIVSQLARIEAADAALAPFTERMRKLAREFRFDTMAEAIGQALGEPVAGRS
jgi:CheY-like chemotaxis protein/anti-sigma regulatory factor (Ser/Thr protein kinase)